MKNKGTNFIPTYFMLSATLCLASIACAAELEDKPILSQLPDNTRATLTRLFGLVDDVDVTEIFGTTAIERHNEIITLLGRLGGQIDDELVQKIKASDVPDDLHARIKLRLLEMARYYAKNNRYKELIGRYGKVAGFKINGATITSRALRAPPLMEKHIDEKYRLAWEMTYILPDPDADAFIDPRAYEALKKIQSNDSIVVFVYAFSRLCREDIPQNENVAKHQMSMIIQLSDYHNEKALKAILKCLSLSDAVGGPEGGDGSLYEQVFDVFDWYATRDPEAKKSWYAVIRKYPKEELSERQRQLLERVSKHLKP